jgi:hypothetical protein
MESSDIHNTTMEQQHAHTLTPIIEAIEPEDSTITTSNSAQKRDPAESKRLLAQNALILQLQKSLLTTQEALQESEINKAEMATLLRSINTPQQRTVYMETPGPHRLRERQPRPEDTEYRERMRQQEREEKEHEDREAPANPNGTVLDIDPACSCDEGYQHV